jgi:class 3 adenylate cyclase/TolB-like protein
MTSSSTRRLAAVMIADVAGYSRLMERDEAGTHARLKQIRAEVTDPVVLRHGGRIVRTVGDGLLAEFPSALSALQAAIEIQRAMAARNDGLPKERRIDHRIGINLGDILVDEHDIAGNGVNVAARLEAIAPPGGIAVSGTVRRQVGDDLGVVFVDAGQQQVRNIARPIRVFQVRLNGPPSLLSRLRGRRWPRWAFAAAALLALVAGVWLGRTQPTPGSAPPSLVVLPFAHPAQGPGAEALAESMTRQLTGALSQLTGLAVIAPAIAAQLGGRRGEMKAIGRELNARYALDGRIERVGDEARAEVHLVDTGSGSSLWSNRLQAAATGDTAPLALVGQLAESLRAAVREAELKRLSPEDAEASAHALALAATDELQRTSDPKRLDAIRARFEHALALDPEHVPALTGYVHTLVYEADRTAPGPLRDAVLRRADQLSLRAVTLRPDDAEAWAARTNVLLFQGRPEAAAEAVQRGLQLNSYLVPLQSFSGQLSLAQGRGEQALAAFERGLALNPSGAGHGVLMHFRCRALLLLDRLAEAIDSCERGMAFGPEWPDYMVLTAAYALKGEVRQAERARAELMRLQPAFSIGWHESLAGRGPGTPPTAFEQVLHDGLRRAGVPE